MQSKVSIICPVIRPEGVKRLIRSINKNAGIPKQQYEIVTETDTDRIGCPKMVKRLVAKTKYDLVCFLGDDVEIKKDCLKIALKAMSELPDSFGLVGLNDGFQNGNDMATHWIASKKLLPFLGGEFFHTGYIHCRCDKELTDRAKKLKRYIWAIDAKLKHNHPAIKGVPREEWDNDYKKAYLEENVLADNALFASRERQEKRKNFNWAKLLPEDK